VADSTGQEQQGAFMAMMEAAQKSFVLKLTSLLCILMSFALVGEGAFLHADAMMHAKAWIPIGAVGVLLQAPWMILFSRDLVKR
jgi:hypothetical protein